MRTANCSDAKVSPADLLRDLLVDRGAAGVVLVDLLGAGQHVHHAAVVAVAARAVVARLHVQVEQHVDARLPGLQRLEDRAELRAAAARGAARRSTCPPGTCTTKKRGGTPPLARRM
jgi:hypothetical protein